MPELDFRYRSDESATVEVFVDCNVLAAPASGIAVYLREVLAHLPNEVSVTRRPAQSGASAGRQWARRIPGAYALRALRAGWPRPPNGAVFWQPNFLLPPWPLTPARSVATIHDTIFLDHPEWADAHRGRFMRAGLAATLRRAARIITPSTQVAARLRAIDAGARCVVIPEGIRRLPLVEPRARKSILCFGNIEPRKGTHTLVAAYRALPEELRRAHPLVIAGAVHDGEYARDTQVGERPDDAKLSQLIAESAVVVAPSLAEGFGLVPLEAYAEGAAVLASDLAVTRELLGDRIDYFAAGDAAALAAQLERLLHTPRYPSAEARSEVTRRYSWETCAAAHAQVFVEVAQRG